MQNEFIYSFSSFISWCQGDVFLIPRMSGRFFKVKGERNVLALLPGFFVCSSCFDRLIELGFSFPPPVPLWVWEGGWKIQDVDFLENLSCYNLLSAQVRLFVKACVRLRLPKSPTTRTQNQHQHTQKFTPVFGFVWLPNHWTSRTSDRSARVQRMPDYGCQILEARTERWPKGTSERETHATLSDKCCSSLGLAKKVSSTLCRYPSFLSLRLVFLLMFRFYKIILLLNL